MHLDEDITLLSSLPVFLLPSFTNSAYLSIEKIFRKVKYIFYLGVRYILNVSWHRYCSYIKFSPSIFLLPYKSSIASNEIKSGLQQFLLSPSLYLKVGMQAGKSRFSMRAGLCSWQMTFHNRLRPPHRSLDQRAALLTHYSQSQRCDNDF